jgi:4-amino-4-deoxy-L-arabinose transferase-like glycosyltransferase
VTINRSARAAWLVCAASLACSLVLALSFPLVDPDEGRNAEVAAEMARGGDVVIPHLAGVPYLDKPPALFALAALSIRSLGHVPLAARLPAILASLVTLLLIARAA